jgi:23S rRNA (adenine(2503)-C(2))-methyltransferase
MNILEVKNFLRENKYPNYRESQIFKGVFHDAMDSFEKISVLPKDLRKKLCENVDLLPFTILHVATSKNNDAIKALFQLYDGNIIESVLISPKPGKWSACISCQVGCAMGCTFCATGKLGIKRNLTVDEITSQVLFWRQYLKNNISGDFSNIVYMGMGEPFMNWQNVKESIAIFTDEKYFNFPKRGLSVSTSGIVLGIKKFADECPQINLALSLHFATDKKRGAYMPVNKNNDLTEIKNALKYYFSKNNRKVFIEYIMLREINDTDDDAKNLVTYLKSIGKKHLLHVNLIRYNSIGKGFAPSDKNTVRRFQLVLEREKIICTIRKSVGDDIYGACGQLAGLKRSE